MKFFQLLAEGAIAGRRSDQQEDRLPEQRGERDIFPRVGSTGKGRSSIDNGRWLFARYRGCNTLPNKEEGADQRIEDAKKIHEEVSLRNR